MPRGAPGGRPPGLALGISVHDSLMTSGAAGRRRLLTLIDQAGIDYVGVGDHVSFHDGTGFDGLISATAALSGSDRLPVLVGIYLLALRHPLLTARQLASISQLAPGRLMLGAGAGGEDRSEISNSGVDPATRGRRLDECLAVLRALASGETVDHRGEFFTLEAAGIRPAPSPPVPLIIGGKGEAAVRRAARYGDGWLAIFCSPRRFAQTRQQIAGAAAAIGRTPPAWYGINIWCGLDTDHSRARELLARQLEMLYHLPFERFERVALAGTPAQVAEQLAPFVAAGAANLTVIPAAASAEAGIEHVAAVRAALHRESPGAGPASGILG
jgi:alkanesulfonate monooxygenase SsuD/methylene tetrahydromethanopterin reductase-like flavin-dependent oxidoreductase (luciferase family)